VSNLIAGNSYPSFGSTIPANGSNGNSDHFFSENVGDGTNSLDYVLKLFRVDENNVEVGNSVTFTYRYTPNLSNADFNQLATLGIQLKSSVIKNSIDLQVTNQSQANVYDLNGKLVATQSLVAGDNSIEVSKLASGVYLVNITTIEGKKATVKIIKE
jgi:Secretion system C-terminal sorting domain